MSFSCRALKQRCSLDVPCEGCVRRQQGDYCSLNRNAPLAGESVLVNSLRSHLDQLEGLTRSLTRGAGMTSSRSSSSLDSNFGSPPPTRRLQRQPSWLNPLVMADLLPHSSNTGLFPPTIDTSAPPHPFTPSPPLSLGEILAIFPSPLQSSHAVSAYFAHGNPDAVLDPDVFVRRASSSEGGEGATGTAGGVDFAWLAEYFAVVGLGAVLAERFGAGGVGGSGDGEVMGRAWLGAAVGLLSLADWVTHPSLESLRAICVLNEWWLSWSDGGHHIAAIAFNVYALNAAHELALDVELNFAPAERAAQVRDSLLSSDGRMRLLHSKRPCSAALSAFAPPPARLLASVAHLTDPGSRPPSEYVVLSLEFEIQQSLSTFSSTVLTNFAGLRLHQPFAESNASLAARAAQYAENLVALWEELGSERSHPLEACVALVAGATHLARCSQKDSATLMRLELLARLAASSTSPLLQRGGALLQRVVSDSQISSTLDLALAQGTTGESSLVEDESPGLWDFATPASDWGIDTGLT